MRSTHIIRVTGCSEQERLVAAGWTIKSVASDGILRVATMVRE